MWAPHSGLDDPLVGDRAGLILRTDIGRQIYVLATARDRPKSQGFLLGPLGEYNVKSTKSSVTNSDVDQHRGSRIKFPLHLRHHDVPLSIAYTTN